MLVIHRIMKNNTCYSRDSQPVDHDPLPGRGLFTTGTCACSSHKTIPYSPSLPGPDRQSGKIGERWVTVHLLIKMNSTQNAHFIYWVTFIDAVFS